jgi:hypothetical protein
MTETKTPVSLHLNGKTLAGILVRHSIIDPSAVEDPEGYDGGITMLRVREAAKDITKAMAPSIAGQRTPS